MNNPIEVENKEVPATIFYTTKDEQEDFEDLRFVRNEPSIAEPEDYSSYIFARNYKKFNDPDHVDPDQELTSVDSLRVSGNYNPQKYKTEFSLDYVYTSASIDNLFGTTGLANIAWSDVMGDHQLRFASNLVMDLDNSDIILGLSLIHI